MKTYRNYLLGVLSLSLISATAIADPGHGPGGRFMKYFDTNHDNMVTLNELNAVVKQRFEKMDADADGFVTLKEFQAYISERRAQHQQQRFAEIDANSDGNISQDEYLHYRQKIAEQRFQQLDANNDGVVSQEEFQANKRGWWGGKSAHGGKFGMRRHGGGGRFFARMDSNNDGRLTLEENLAAWTNWFKRIDTNNDQVVTADEVKAFRDKVMER